MELLIAFVAGLVLAVVIYYIFKVTGRAKTKLSSPSTNYLRLFSKTEAKKEAFRNSRNQFSLHISREECIKQLHAIVSRRSEFTDENYEWLIREGNRRLKEIDDFAAEKIETEPRLVQYRSFKDTAAPVKLFNELHRIVTGKSKIISYSDIETFGAAGELEWFKKTYDKLLTPRLRQLLMSARNGSLRHYQQAMTLWEELDDFESSEQESREEFVERHLAQEWNEMIVRYKRDPDWYNDLMGLENLTDDDYKTIIKKAKEEGDFLSLWLVVKLAEDDFSSFSDTLLAVTVEEFKIKLDVQHVDLGFIPGQDERGINATN